MGRVAVVTGAGGGVAPAVVRRFAAAGYGLALVTRPDKQGEVDGLVAEARELLGAAGDVRAFGADLADPAAAAAVMERAEGELGPVSALLNLAGGFAAGPVDSGGADRLARMLEVNFHTAVNATSALLPRLLERGGGFVAMVGASAALSPGPRQSAYAAAKGALTSYTRALAAELGERGVNVALLIPKGTIDTPGNRAAMPDADRSRWVQADALADALIFLAERKAGGRVHELVVSAR